MSETFGINLPERTTRPRSLAGEPLIFSNALMGALRFIEHSAAPILKRVGDDWHLGRLAAKQFPPLCKRHHPIRHTFQAGG